MVTGEKSKTGQRVAIGVLSAFSFIWVAPILFTIVQSFRPFADVVLRGVVCLVTITMPSFNLGCGSFF
jgi:ABC-type glycerol-3-phosphate transport system permease component